MTRSLSNAKKNLCVCVCTRKKKEGCEKRNKKKKLSAKKKEVRHGLGSCEGRKRRDNSLSTHTHDGTKEKKTVKDNSSFFFSFRLEFKKKST